MQLRSTRDPNKFYVDWWLMNHCTWHCDYCHDVLRSGNIALPYLRDCLGFIDSAQLWAQAQGKTTRIKFTGGEVTEWADFDQLLKYAHSQGCETEFRTNANVERNRWLALMAHTDLVSIGYHPKHTSKAQFLLAIDGAVKLGVNPMIDVNMLPDEFDELEALVVYIKERWPTIRVNKAMRFHNPIANTRPLDYTPVQELKLKRQYGDLQWDNGDYTDYQELLLDNANKFKGWACAAGTEQCVVDAWGRVYRGHCRMNGFMGNIAEHITWPETLTVCNVDSCVNAFDIQATKTSLP
jgi:pyruvate-formate lyase-activating enzyme